MASFDEREKGFESKYKLDQDLQFKVQARRNKLLGLWAAELLGKSGAAADAYAQEVVASDFEKPGDTDVLDKVTNDLMASGVRMDAHAVRKQMDKLLDTAKKQVIGEVK